MEENKLIKGKYSDNKNVTVKIHSENDPAMENAKNNSLEGGKNHARV